MTSAVEARRSASARLLCYNKRSMTSPAADGSARSSAPCWLLLGSRVCYDREGLLGSRLTPCPLDDSPSIFYASIKRSPSISSTGPLSLQYNSTCKQHLLIPALAFLRESVKYYENSALSQQLTCCRFIQGEAELYALENSTQSRRY